MKAPTPMDQPISCAVARVSLEDKQAKHGYSLKAQAEMLKEIAAREGFRVPEGFILFDDGFEGDDWSRPAIAQALRLVQAGKAKAVTFLNTDRFARDLPGGRALIAKIRAAGGDVVFGDLGRFRDDANFMLQLNVKLSIAEYEKANIKWRSRICTLQKIREGKPNGGHAPYGYRFVTKAEGVNALVVVPEQAAIVRRIFALAAKGKSLRGILRTLNAEAVKPPRSNWNCAVLSNMLRNRTYIGEWHYNKRQAVEPNPEKIRKPEKIRHRRRTSAKVRPASEWIAVKVDDIVDAEVFARVSNQVARNVNSLGGRPSDRYLLKGLLWCGTCGKRCNGWLDRGVVRYICANRDRATGKYICGATHVRGGALEGSVWDAVVAAVNSDLARAVNARRKQLSPAPNARELARLKARIEELKQREFKARRAALDAEDPETEQLYADEIRETRAQRSELSRELEAKAPSSDAGLDGEALTAIRLALTTEERGERQQILQRAVSRVTYKEGEAEIDLRIPLRRVENCLQEQPPVNSFFTLTIRARVA